MKSVFCLIGFSRYLCANRSLLCEWEQVFADKSACNKFYINNSLEGEREKYLYQEGFLSTQVQYKIEHQLLIIEKSNRHWPNIRLHWNALKFVADIGKLKFSTINRRCSCIPQEAYLMNCISNVLVIQVAKSAQRLLNSLMFTCYLCMTILKWKHN